MPTLTRFILVLGLLSGLILGSLYVLAVFFEPSPVEVVKPVFGIKVRTP